VESYQALSATGNKNPWRKGEGLAKWPVPEVPRSHIVGRASRPSQHIAPEFTDASISQDAHKGQPVGILMKLHAFPGILPAGMMTVPRSNPAGIEYE
jgi:hypothetical protein